MKPIMLVVDDEAAILKSLKRLFHDDYEVLTAENAQDALHILEQSPVHLIISDYRMPGLDGLAFLRQVKERWPEIIRIMLTGYADVNSMMDDISSGVIYRFVSKPWNDDELYMAIRLAMQQYKLINQIKKLKLEKGKADISSPTDLMIAEQERRGENKFTLLFVDDEEYVLRTLKRLFADDDYQVMTAGSAEDAVTILEMDPVHLVVSDFRMPGMDGLEFLRLVQQRWPATIRVMLTGVADSQGLMDDISEGVIYKFISKPWQNEELKMAVRLALRQYVLIEEMKKLLQ